VHRNSQIEFGASLFVVKERRLGRFQKLPAQKFIRTSDDERNPVKPLGEDRDVPSLPAARARRVGLFDLDAGTVSSGSRQTGQHHDKQPGRSRVLERNPSAVTEAEADERSGRTRVADDGSRRSSVWPGPRPT